MTTVHLFDDRSGSIGILTGRVWCATDSPPGTATSNIREVTCLPCLYAMIGASSFVALRVLEIHSERVEALSQRIDRLTAALTERGFRVDHAPLDLTLGERKALLLGSGENPWEMMQMLSKIVARLEGQD